MNRIARTLTNLTIATGMATAALTMGGVAHAETPPAPKPGPVIVLPPSEPGPNGPGDIATPEPGPVDPTDGPDDIKAPAPKPQPPKGPKDLSNGDSDPVVDPKPADHHHGTGSAPADKGTTKPAPKSAGTAGTTPTTEAPATTDAVTDTTDVAPVTDYVAPAAQQSRDSDYLLWLLAGLGAAGAAGVIVVVARRRKAAEQA